MAERRKGTRRDFLKWSSLGLLAGATGLAGCAPAAVQLRPPAEDLFSACLAEYRQAEADQPQKSLLNCYVHCLPELQRQPRPISAEALGQRLELASALRAELAQMPAAEIIGQALPVTIRYPGWLAAAVSIELFELALAHSPLPEFELKGWAYEHVEPHVASIDRALAPLCRLMRTPGDSFSAELEQAVADPLDNLRGRLVLLGDESLVEMAAAIRQTLAQGEKPGLLRVLVVLEDTASTPGPQLQYGLASGAPFEGDLTWRFSGPLAGWNSVGRRDVRAVDRLVGAVFTAGLTAYCE